MAKSNLGRVWIGVAAIFAISVVVLSNFNDEQEIGLSNDKNTTIPTVTDDYRIEQEDNEIPSSSTPDLENSEKPKLLDDIEIVSRRGIEVEAELEQIAKNFHANADRLQFVQFDNAKFMERLRYTPAYMYAESGNSPAPAPPPGKADLAMALFDDRVYELSITSVSINEINGTRQLLIEGNVVNGGDGIFRLSLPSDGKLMSGFIDTDEYFTRLDTWKISDNTAVAEYERATVDQYSGPID